MIGLYLAAKIGPTVALTVTSGVSTTTQLITTNIRPTLFVLRATTSTYINQGGSTVTASSSNMQLPADTYYPLMVESEGDSYIATNGVAASGTLYATNGSRVT